MGEIDIDLLKQEYDILEFISQYVDLKNKKGSKNFFGLCPFHNEVTSSFRVNIETQKFKCYGCNKKGDILDFVQLYFNKNLPQAIKYLSKGIRNLVKHDEYVAFRYIKSCQTSQKPEIPKPIYLNESCMNIYTKEPIMEWISEGISQKVLDYYNVRYDKRTKRIVFPLRDETGKIRSVKGRTLLPNYKQLNIKKYMNYNKLIVNNILFGEWVEYKRDIIRKTKQLFLFEGEKSVMKMDTLGIYNSLATCTSNMDITQVNKLLGYKSDIYICFDKEKGIDEIKQDNMIKILRQFTNVFMVADLKGDKLSDKDSPIDRGIDVWNNLDIVLIN